MLQFFKSRRSNRSNNGRESVNSFDDMSVKNSQSGATETVNSSSLRNKNSISNSNNNYLGSTDTISRSVNQRETLHSRFDFVRVLGKGTYGKVKLANDKRTGKQVSFFRSYLNLVQTV